MNINEAFPSKYLAAADLKGVAVTLVMAHVTMEKIREDARPVLYFQGKEKGMVLNKTNGRTISQIYGGETEHWAGKSIRLFPTETDYQGKRVPCIRVGVPTKPRPEDVPPGNVDMADGDAPTPGEIDGEDYDPPF